MQERDQDPIDPRGRELSYLVVARRVRRRIEAGEWSPGAPIPSEPDLGEWYGVSRTTVRAAVRALVADGMVEVVPGKGTYVTWQEAAGLIEVPPPPPPCDKAEKHVPGGEHPADDLGRDLVTHTDPRRCLGVNCLFTGAEPPRSC